MSTSTDEQTLREQGDEEVPIDEGQLLLQIEREVMGCDYGATSYTTRSQAERISHLLRLRPGMRLLDVGAGSGWPGLFLARTTGCDVALVDRPLQGLRVASERAVKDELSGRYSLAVGDGTALPFRSGWFDAITHCDVLC